MKNTIGCLGLCVLFAGFNGVHASEIIINEIMYHPGYGDVGSSGYIAEDPLKEFVELKNTGTNTVNLAGWQIKGAVSFAFTNTVIGPQAYLVVAADSDISRFKDSYKTQYPGVVQANVVGGWSGTLGNNGQKLVLEDPTGKNIDEVFYANEGDWAARRTGDPYPGSPNWWRGWRWFSGADAGGKSLELVDPSKPNKYGQNWGDSVNDGGTPGGINSLWNTNTAPLIVEVKHAPAIPKSTDPVVISARLVPASDENTVTLCYREDGTNAFSTVQMFDDGQHGDGAFADGIYGAFLPPHPNKTIIEFYVQVSGREGVSRTWPGASDDQDAHEANALYQVDDSVYTGNQPVYRLIIRKAEWNAWTYLMDSVSGGQYSDASMHGTFISVDGTGEEVRYCVSVRNRGAGTRAAHPHNLHIAFSHDQPWKNMTALSLNTRTVHSQVAGNAINALAGLHNPYGAPVQVRINGDNLAHAVPTGSTDSFQFGSYYAFQPYGNEWLDQHIPTDAGGNIYKGVWNFDGHSLNHSANFDYLGTNYVSYRLAYSATGPTSGAGPYSKQNHVSENDWSDLINLCRVFKEATDEQLVEQINQVVNIDEWLTYIAVTALVGNRETTFGTGTGDDYSMYRGGRDPRFILLPHDMDTVLGQGDAGADYNRSIFEACDIPAVNRLLKHPAIVPRYFAILRQQAKTTFASETINPLLDQVLHDWVSDQYIQNMKDYVVLRRAGVLAQIPDGISITSDLPVVNGYPRTSNTTLTLSGKADGVRTRSIWVNGIAASWTAWTASWSVQNIPLMPGINRVVVQAFDENHKEVDNSAIDIWCDTGTVTSVSGGTLSVSTNWSAQKGPYLITQTLAIPSGVTLTIEPGTTVYLASGVSLTVANGGRILAEGTSDRYIRIASQPGSGASWGGITINGSVGTPETRIAYAYIEGNGDKCIEVAGGTLYLDHTVFGTTTHQYLSLDDSSFLVSNCYFPTATAGFELLHGTGGIKAGGRGIIRECFFGKVTGYNDTIDFTGNNRPGEPIIEFYNNVFTGTGDDNLDLDGTDAWIEGNIFLHIHKNGSPDSSSAVSGGDDGSNTSEVTMVGNLIYDCDQAAMAKQGNFFTLINNTIIRQTKQGGLDTDAAVVCLADEGTEEGAGMYLEGNIICDAEKLVRLQTTSVVTFTNNLMPLAWDGPGGGNSTNSPQLTYIPQMSETIFTNWSQAQIMRQWFRPQAGSRANGTGPNGSDMGGVIPFGASVAGEPVGTTSSSSAILTVGPLATNLGVAVAGFPEGSGFTHYRWKLDDGEYGAETPTSTPITLTGLADGPHSVTVIGRNDAGRYQNDAELGATASVTQSRTWIVDSKMGGRVRINEILAFNAGAVTVNGGYPDVIELYNEGGQPVDLSGMGLSSNPTNKWQYVIPVGTVLSAGQYLVLYGDNSTNIAGLHMGFGVDRSGDALYLWDQNGACIDSIVFGLQIPNYSIGRLADGGWGLAVPTFGAENQRAPSGDPALLRINEWLADAHMAAPADFVELYNPGSDPVSIGGFVLADQSVGQLGLPTIPALSFVAGKGFALFYADGKPESGANHLDFTLSAMPGAIGLFTTNLSPVDVVLYGPQTTDVSQGRTPNGGVAFEYYPEPTPGTGNPGSDTTTTIVTQTFPLIVNTNVWNYYQTGIPETNWISPDYTGDAMWPAGAALLYVESSSKPWPKNTPLTLGRMTYYFRTHFQVATNLTGATLNLRAIIDDGAVFYLNGKEVLRLHIDTNVVVNYNTAASDHESALEGPYTSISVTNLVPGDNVMAVEVHQVNSSSSDVVFGMSLDATISTTNTTISTNMVSVELNEVLAHNVSLTNLDGQAPDWIELRNKADSVVDLSGMSLSDDPSVPRRWVFPESSVIGPNGLLVVYCDGNSVASATNTGFGLKSTGGSVGLYDSLARDGRLIDSVTFGLQVADLSIGRSGTNGTWLLCQPTLAKTNQAVEALGTPDVLKINEWMASPGSGDDWFEIYNPQNHPVELSGLKLTDSMDKPDQSPIPSLSFIGTGAAAWQKINADSSPEKGANHANFKLSASGEQIILLTSQGVVIDRVTFGPQLMDISEGRYPDGSTNLVSFANTPTPGKPNVYNPVLVDSDGDGLPDDWEANNGLNSLDPTDARLDSDGDGLDNLQEYQAGTNPRDPSSTLCLLVDMGHTDVIALHFEAQPGKSYSIVYRDAFGTDATNSWIKLQDVPASPVSTQVTITQTNNGERSARFYRVVTPAMP